MSVYQSSPGTAPDQDFEPGSLDCLVVGNRGRMLDARRTPVSVVDLRLETGFVALRIEGFEDAGAIWDVPLEDVAHFQFERGSRRASESVVGQMRDAIERFDQELVIEASRADRRQSLERIAELQAEADSWLGEHSRFLAQARSLPDPSARCGDDVLAADFEAWMGGHNTWDTETAFATQFVSNPGSGEIVKGHRIVLAELGLVSYAGTVVRDPETFSGAWGRERRAHHIVTRLAFLAALFARLGLERVMLWRGLSAEGPLRTGRRRTFVSTSFAEVVARSHFDAGAGRSTRVLVGRQVPVDRLFMTYLETAAMNDRFLEAEAVLLAGPNDGWS
jgi:hypothetical protein